MQKVKYAFGWPNWPKRERENARNLACRALENDWDAETIKARGVDHKALRSASIGYLDAHVRYADKVLGEQDHVTGKDVIGAVIDLKATVNHVYRFLLITGDVARANSFRVRNDEEIDEDET